MGGCNTNCQFKQSFACRVAISFFLSVIKIIFVIFRTDFYCLNKENVEVEFKGSTFVLAVQRIQLLLKSKKLYLQGCSIEQWDNM